MATRALLNAQLEVVTSRTATERCRQEAERKDTDRLPSRKEFQDLIRGISERLAKLKLKPKASFTYSEYLTYCKYVIARIVTYNLRRSGEVATMSLKQFAECTKGREIVLFPFCSCGLICLYDGLLFTANMDDLPVGEMTEEEKKLALSISNISLRGKYVSHVCRDEWQVS